MKKILFIIGGIVLIVLVGFGIWSLFLRGEDSIIKNVFEDEVNFGTFFDTQGSVSNVFDGNYDDLEESDFVRETRLPILRQISSEPVAGYTFFTKEFEELKNVELGTTTESSTEPEKILVDKYVFRFIERGTGHVYETVEDSLTVEKVTNTTIQKINTAIFSENNSKILFEKLSDTEEGIDSFVAEIIIPENSTSTQPYLEIQPYSIISDSFSKEPKTNNFIYLISSSYSSSIVKDNFENLTEKILVDIPLKDLLIEWGGESLALLTTKPSYDQPGYSYLLNTNTGSYKKILGEINGLTTKINSEGTKVLYSESNNNSISLNILDLETKEIKSLSLSALPEKCVFSNMDENIIYCASQNRNTTENLPDGWYKGKILFEDLIWKINTETNQTSLVYNFDSTKYGFFDAINLKLTPEDEYLTFVNKRDLSLWSLSLKELGSNF